MTNFFYTLERDAAAALSESAVIVEWDYSGDSCYQVDFWFKNVNLTEEQAEEVENLTSDLYEHPVMFLRTAPKFFGWIQSAFPYADIILVDSFSSQGIRNSLDISAKNDILTLKSRLENGDYQ